MPNKETAKTKSAPKSRYLIAILAVAIAVFGFVAYNKMQDPFDHLVLPNSTVTYKLEPAISDAMQKKGLGYRDSLPGDQGMLFIFSRNNAPCFWMKGMRFPLDMIWLSDSRKIVHIEQNLSPATYPKAFCAKEPASYVVELNAGQAKTAHMTIGEQLKF